MPHLVRRDESVPICVEEPEGLKDVRVLLQPPHLALHQGQELVEVHGAAAVGVDLLKMSGKAQRSALCVMPQKYIQHLTLFIRLIYVQ